MASDEDNRYVKTICNSYVNYQHVSKILIILTNVVIFTVTYHGIIYTNYNNYS
jgi:hypothetical protein